jgi:hypothetical protein
VTFLAHRIIDEGEGVQKSAISIVKKFLSHLNMNYVFTKYLKFMMEVVLQL